MNEINRERFEAWLFAQPGDREFNYLQGGSEDLPGCPVCNFIRETTAIKNFGVGGDFIMFENGKLLLPKWALDLLHSDLHLPYVIIHLTAALLQDRWLKLFPESPTITQPEKSYVHLQTMSESSK